MNNETRNMVTPWGVTVDHASMNKTAKITDTILVCYMQWIPSAVRMKTD